MKNKTCTYLGTRSDIVTLFNEEVEGLKFILDTSGLSKPILPDEELNSRRSGVPGLELLRMNNAGSNGSGSVKDELLSIRTTKSIVGLSLILS